MVEIISKETVPAKFQKYLQTGENKMVDTEHEAQQSMDACIKGKGNCDEFFKILEAAGYQVKLEVKQTALTPKEESPESKLEKVRDLIGGAIHSFSIEMQCGGTGAKIYNLDHWDEEIRARYIYGHMGLAIFSPIYGSLLSQDLNEQAKGLIKAAIAFRISYLNDKLMFEYVADAFEALEDKKVDLPVKKEDFDKNIKKARDLIEYVITGNLTKEIQSELETLKVPIDTVPIAREKDHPELEEAMDLLESKSDNKKALGLLKAMVAFQSADLSDFLLFMYLKNAFNKME